MLRRGARCSRAAAPLRSLPAAARAGTFAIAGPTIVYNGDAGDDQIAGFDTGDSIRFTRFGGATSAAATRCDVSPDGRPSTARRTGIIAVLLDLGGGDDVAAVSATSRCP